MTHPSIKEVREAIELAEQRPITMAWQKTIIKSAEAYCEMQWQPIETAPKDGGSILVYCPNMRIYGKNGNVVITYWQRHAAHDPRYAYGWVGLYDDKNEPTHWMPLPQPPKEIMR